ncbi:MAG: hypothetical protein M0D53_06015 [Flavobacterium sp. JAD_PAG50586_2]|nr:MAG: hypothetical protein M0D53_06015 [Flavobacterium sp. JAD_PAG50586_2]
MIYSVENLTQTLDCDVLLALAQQEKGNLDFQRLSESRQTNRYGITSVELELSIQETIADIAAEESAIASLPDGNRKDERIFNKKQLEFKLVSLQHRKKSYGVIALLEQEMELGRVLKEIEEVDAFIAAVSARREELAA